MRNLIITSLLSILVISFTFSQANRPVISARSSLGNVILGPSHDNSISTSYDICQPETVTVTGWRFLPFSITGYYNIKWILLRNGNKFLERGGYVSLTNWTPSNQGFSDVFSNLILPPGRYQVQLFIEKHEGWWIFKKWETWINETSPNYLDISNKPATPNYTINGQAIFGDTPIDVCSGNIKIDASLCQCESKYSINVQESDRYWNRTNQYEWGTWFNGIAPNNLNLQYLSTVNSTGNDFVGSASRQNTPLISGSLPNNGGDRYYRVSVCTGEPSWNCKTALIRVKCDCE
ncbi:hypothetical protein SAMN06298216_1698 [Spirosomataceae bacterium TFI 002]|nr:hypothetical protein SAMN06298216_1698 [Spirosomataceae bacterium TFI 002]